MTLRLEHNTQELDHGYSIINCIEEQTEMKQSLIEKH